MGRWFSVSMLVIVLDQITKYVADEKLSYGRPVELLPVFDLTLFYNQGAAFSFLAGAGGWQRWFLALLAIVISIALAVWVMRLAKHQWLQALALTLILGGALGNLYDRISLGHVIDFISVHYGEYYFPAFNLADSAITLGAIFLFFDMLGFGKGKAGTKV